MTGPHLSFSSEVHRKIDAQKGNKCLFIVFIFLQLPKFQIPSYVPSELTQVPMEDSFHLHSYKSWKVARLPSPSPGSDLPTMLMARKDWDTMKKQASQPERRTCDRMPRAELVVAPGLYASSIYLFQQAHGGQSDNPKRCNLQRKTSHIISTLLKVMILKRTSPWWNAI